MGIRFLCPNGHKLNVKQALAGKHGICPDCGAKFLIPASPAGLISGIAGHSDLSLPVEAPEVEPTGPAVWCLRPITGGEYGPVTAEVFADWIAEGRVTTDAHVWCEGWPQWRTALDAAELLPTRETASPVTVATNHVEEKSIVSGLSETLTIPGTAPAIVPAMADDAETTAWPPEVRRAQIRQLQFALAIVMFLLVIILAGVLVWVLRRNPTETVLPEPPAPAVSWYGAFESRLT